MVPRLLGFLLAVLGCAPAAGGEEWLEVRSPHFTVLTDAGEGSGRRIAREFELIRVVFQQAFGHSPVDPAEPIFIYALQEESGMAELLPRIWEDETRAKPVGLFRLGTDRNYVALLLNTGGDRPSHKVPDRVSRHAVSPKNLAGHPIQVVRARSRSFEPTPDPD